VWLAIDSDGAPDDVMSAAETLLPASLTQNDHVIISRHIFAREKGASELWLDAKDREQVRRNAKSADYLGGLPGLSQARVAQGICADLPVSLHLSLQAQKVRGRDAALGILRCDAVKSLQLLAPGIGQRLQQNGIDDAEHGSVSANPQAEGDDGEERETRAAEERAGGEAETGEHMVVVQLLAAAA